MYKAFIPLSSKHTRRGMFPFRDFWGVRDINWLFVIIYVFTIGCLRVILLYLDLLVGLCIFKIISQVLTGAVFCIFRTVLTWLSSCSLKATRWERKPDCRLLQYQGFVFWATHTHTCTHTHTHANECRHSWMPAKSDTHRATFPR